MKKRIWIIPIVLVMALGLSGAALAAARTATPVEAEPQASRLPQGFAQPQEMRLPESASNRQASLQMETSRPPFADLMAQARWASRYPQTGAALEAQVSASPADPVSRQLGIQGSESVAAGFTLDLAYDAVLGRLTPGDRVTVTLPGGGFGAAETDAAGFFWTPLWQPNGQPLELAGGEQVSIYVNGSLQTVVTPTAINGELDVLTDEVSGTLSGLGANVPVTVSIGIWGGLPAEGSPAESDLTAPDGSFAVIFSAKDLTPSDMAQVSYLADTSGMGGVVVRDYIRPNPAFLIQNRAVIAGYAPPGAVVTATVYEGVSPNVRWQGSMVAPGPFGFYNFSSDMMGNPFAEIGDGVTVAFDDGTFLTTIVADLHDVTFDATGNLVSGNAPNGAFVLLYSWTQSGSLAVYRETSVVAGAGGFNAALPFDLLPREWVNVSLTDAQGNANEIFGGAPYINAQIDPFSEADCVWGRTDAPQAPITLSIQTNEGVYTRFSHPNTNAGNMIGSPWGVCLLVWQPGVWGPINFAPGDVITLSSPTWSGSMVVPDVNWNWDVESDLVWGDAPDGEMEVRARRWASEHYPDEAAATRLGTASGGGYNIPLDNFDLRHGDTLYIRHFDPTSDFAADVTGVQGYLLPYFQVQPNGVGGAAAYPDEPVTASLYDTGGNLVGAANWDHDGNPLWFWLDLGMNLWQPGYWITVTGDSGWQAGLEIPQMDIQVDTVNNLVWGEAPKSTLFLVHEWPEGGHAAMLPSDGYVLDTLAYSRPLELGDWLSVHYLHPSGNIARRETGVGDLFRLEFWLNESGDTGVWGNAVPNSVVTLTTAGGQYTFPTNEIGDWDGNISPALQPGEVVTATAGSGLFPVTTAIPDPLEAQADSTTEEVWGQIGGWYTRTVQVHGNWPDGGQEVETDAAGNFLATFSDIPRGADGYIRWEDPGATMIVYHRPFRTNDMVFQVNYAHDWVESNYEAGHSVWITLTNDLGGIKATAFGETGEIPWWGGGQTGFSTNHNVLWSGPQPDIQPYDWVYVRLDNGQSSQVHLGEINGELDVDANTVSGTVYAPWYTQTLYMGCGVWVDGGPGPGGLPVDPQGGSFFCDFSPYDVLPGMDVGVQYQQPSGDSVINVFRAPAPHLEIQFWSNGTPASGNNFPLRIQYHNNGEVEAANVVITATFAGGTYLGDTSGITPTILPGDVYVWEMGNLPVNHNWQEFDVFLYVDALPGEQLSAVADIETSAAYYQHDDWWKHAEWQSEVFANDTYLNIGMGAWTWDPAPGTEYVYYINVCNNGSTASNDAILTATLHPSTTFMTWWGQYPGWQEISADSQQLVVANTSLGAYQCGEVYVRAALEADAWPGMELHANAVITSTSDLSAGDNQTEVWHSVGSPHTNLSIDKRWNWGMLVPGGELRYNIYYHNNGNLPITGPFYVTDTLPVSVTFRDAIEFGGGPQVDPYAIGDGYVVWEISGLDNGYNDGFEIVLDVDPGAIPGTELLNRAEITRLPGEDSQDDNVSQWLETLYPHGPNLRVRQEYNWHGDDAGRAWYNVALENVGDVAVFNVTFTDTYPLPMLLDGGPNFDWGRLTGWQDHPSEHYFTATFQHLYPGETTWININTNFGGNPVDEGLILINTAAVLPVANETNLGDNSADATLTTGPDLWTFVSRVSGEALPGELITVSLQFGNAQPGHTWWWNLQGNAILTNTLSDGLEYITSTQRFCGPGNDWCPVQPNIQGNDYTWPLWAIHTGEWNEIWVVLRVSPDANGLDVLSSEAEIASDAPALDVEPDYANNWSGMMMLVEMPVFEIAKDFESSRVAGMPVTYTLTVTNAGFGEGTGLQVNDPLPAGVTYGGGGSLVGGLVSWDVPQLGANGDATEVQFWGTLSCQAGAVVTNDEYQVAASDQGVTSTFGTPVAFTTLTPTITADFTASVLSILPGETIVFTGTGATNGTPFTFTWDFGDGQTASGPNASHAFATPGEYDVTLTATDGCGFTASYTLTVTVAPYHLYLPLVMRQYP